MRKTKNAFKVILTVLFSCFLFAEVAGAIPVSGAGVLISGTAVPVLGGKNTQTLTSSEIVRLGTEFLRGNLPWDENDFEMTIEYRGKDIVLPEGAVDLEFRLDGDIRRAGQIPLMAKIKVDGVLKRGVWISTFVKVYSDIVKTRRAFKRGEILTANDVTLERVLISNTNARAATTVEEVVGFKILRNLASGAVITPNMLVKTPIVKRGDRVRLLFEKGIMRITAPGIVRESGFRGNYVKVENMQSKKVVYGRVVDSHTVRVEF